MSDELHEEFKSARDEHVLRSFAHTIWIKVKATREVPDDASRRWPFELLQNAIDAGPRAGRSGVTVEFGWDGDLERPAMVFRHDGAPFSSKDLAALTSGGSNKDYKSVETTGRFGTGFLVTHVLSSRAEISGLLLARHGLEYFSIIVDRDGDEPNIIANAMACEEQVRRATRVAIIEDAPCSAEMRYQTEGPTAIRNGIDTLRAVLPHLFSTCQSLCRVRLRLADGEWEDWAAGDPTVQKIAGGVLSERTLAVVMAGTIDREIRSLRIATSADAPAGALLVVEGGEVGMLSPGQARAYRTFPLRRTDSLPLEVAFDGHYDVDEERNAIQCSDASKPVMANALAAIAVAVKYAVSARLGSAHLLARVHSPAVEAFSVSDRDVWQSQLATLALNLSAAPIVLTTRGLRAAVDGDARVDFPLPRLLADDQGEMDVSRMHALFRGVAHFKPVEAQLVVAWNWITEGWKTLGVVTNRVAIEHLAAHIKVGAKTWDLLGNSVQEPHEWLLKLFDAVGECWGARNGDFPAILDGLVPDQIGSLRSPGNLRVDPGISNELKDAAEALGVVVRARLLHGQISAAAAQTHLWPHLTRVVNAVAPTSLLEETLLDDCLKRLDVNLPDGRLAEASLPFVDAALVLARILWRERGVGAARLIQRIPLLASDRSVVRGGPTKRMMMPPSRWDKRARPFVAAYPPARVLDGRYGDDEVTRLLTDCEVAWPDPLIRHKPVELKDQRLSAMARVTSEANGLVVKDTEFPYVAMLHPEIIGRSGVDVNAAKALLGLILCYIARESGWDTWRTVNASKGRSLEVRNALWIGDLLGYSWVPTTDDDERIVTGRGTRANIEGADLLEVEWLKDNEAAVDLLTKCFGFDALDVRLLGAAGEGHDVKTLRSELANVIALSGGDPATLAEVMRQLDSRRRYGEAVQLLRKMGLAIQGAVKAALEAVGGDVDEHHWGMDMMVSVYENGGSAEDASLSGRIGRLLLEVKSTVRDEVSLTPRQARTAGAEADRYTLCVISTEGEDVGAMELSALIDLVRLRARFIDNIGTDAGATAGLVAQACIRPVSLRHEERLRYAVPRARWENGLTFDEWVNLHKEPGAADLSPRGDT